MRAKNTGIYASGGQDAHMNIAMTTAERVTNIVLFPNVPANLIR
jgi:hypothetical protein